MDEFEKVASIADRLREAMRIRDMKQIELVRKTGINRSAISRYLSGEYEPKSKPIYELSKALDVAEQWLMGYDVPIDRPAVDLSEQKEPTVKDDGLSKEMQELIDCIKKLPDDKVQMLLQVARSIR